VRVTVREPLKLRLIAMGRLSSRELVVLSTGVDDTAFLGAYDGWLNPLRRTPVRADALGLTINGDTTWVLDRSGASANGKGASLDRIDFTAPSHLQAGGFVALGGDLIVAFEHIPPQPVCEPTVMRIGPGGEVRWRTSLPIDGVCRGAFRIRDTAMTWVCSYYTAGQLVVSDDAVLVLFRDMPQSGIAVGYVLSLADGALRFTTGCGPIHQIAALRNGEFLVGYQGYGGFLTRHYGRDGTICDNWASHGHYVVSNHDVRVIELRNDSEAMRLVRLLPGGRIEAGTFLHGYYTSPPYLHSNGTLFFCREGVLCEAHDLTVGRRLDLGIGTEVSSRAVVGSEDCIYIVVTRERIEQSAEGVPRVWSRSQLVRVDLR
jgi:hypothetical protein